MQGKVWTLYSRVAGLVMLVVFTVGALRHAVESELPQMLRLTPWVTFGSGVAAVLPALAGGGWPFLLWCAGVYAFTFTAEAVGVATGAVFGAYTYGATLGPAWLGVPVLIAFNWVLVVHGAVCLAAWVIPEGGGVRRRLAVVLLGALVATGFDFIMEPVAIRLDYWTWAGGGIPVQNYAAWFSIALAAAALHPHPAGNTRGPGVGGRLAVLFLVIQSLFFVALRVLLA